jgi:hypothetical protein
MNLPLYSMSKGQSYAEYTQFHRTSMHGQLAIKNGVAGDEPLEILSRTVLNSQIENSDQCTLFLQDSNCERVLLIYRSRL